MHAVDPVQVRANSTRMTEEEIVRALDELPGNAQWVILSGGNPALHDLTRLIANLAAAGYLVSVETQGSRWRDWFVDCDIVCLSPKGPSAGMMDRFKPAVLGEIIDHLEVAGVKFFIKVPLFNEEDVLFLESLVVMYPQVEFFASIGNSWAPGSEMAESHPHENPQTLQHFRNMILDHTTWVTEYLLTRPLLNHVRMVPQVHSLLWGNEKGR